MNDLALNASGISHRYGSQQALLDITFSLPKGTRCGLIGPDGAGKSSLLGLIAGVKKLQEGTLEVLGGPIDNRRHRNTLYPLIAFMPQGLGGNLYPELSISENIRFFGTLFGLSKDDCALLFTAQRPDHPYHSRFMRAVSAIWSSVGKFSQAGVSSAT